MRLGIWIPISHLIIGIVAVPGMDTVIKDYHGKEFLDPKQNYLLEWRIDWTRKAMTFNITVKTNGWVGLGFSKDGLMKDADIVIAGMTPDKRPYITDYHVDCHRNRKADDKQDWKMLGSAEVTGITVVQITRLIDTCDSEDYPITEDLVYLLWAFGETDVEEYHHQNRGSYKLYLLDPVVHPAPSSSSLPRWRASKQLTLPARVTSYWCSIHKAPASPFRKHHIVEGHPVLDRPHNLAVAHVHHMVLWRCFAPPGVNPRDIFEQLVSYVGEECYFNDHNIIPINMCRASTYIWALGGRPLILPDHVGIPFAESPDEYYMLETHYNNPEAVNGINFEAGVELVYTERLRPQDGGVFILYNDFLSLFIIPPGTPKFQVSPHCNSNCTSQMFAARGIDVFAIHTHTHISGRKVKLHQFRNGKELPWVIKDDNYNYQFQTPRPLHVERKFLPGDEFTLDCIYDDTWTNVTTFAGFASTDEMCLQSLYFVGRMQYSWCSSLIPQDNLLRFLGVRNVTWDLITQERIVSSPSSLKGSTLAHVADDLTQWTTSLRNAVAETTLSTPTIITCPITRPTPTLAMAQNVAAPGFVKHQLMGAHAGSSTSTILSRNRRVENEFFRVRTCPAPV